MALFQAFRAVRPALEKAEKVAALPYDVVSREEAREIGEKNPESFLHIDRAEMDLDPETDLYDPMVYQKARENLDRFQKEGILIQDEKPNYYLYELIRKGRSQTGIVGVSSIDDYMNGVIKKHELTREDKEQDRIRHVDVCDANTGPIFLACRYPAELLTLMEEWKNAHTPVYDFTSDDEITHRVWIVDEEEKIRTIHSLFGGISSIYIADGHHRAASAVKVGQKRRAEHPDYTGKEEFNFFLSVVFPYDQLTILPYHRIVKDIKGMEPKAFIGSMKFNFDVSILQDKVLGPVLGISDPRTDERIRFMGGNHRLKDLAAAADETGGAAFAMYPTSMEELMTIADEGKLMPPKSTWFEPKLRSGLFIHKLSD